MVTNLIDKRQYKTVRCDETVSCCCTFSAMASSEACGSLHQVLTDTQVHHILKQVLGKASWHLLRCDLHRAAEGLTGFLGDHYRATLHVRVGESMKTVQLFVKTMPQMNKNKASFIDKCNFFRREMLTFQVFENIGGDHGKFSLIWDGAAKPDTFIVVVRGN